MKNEPLTNCHIHTFTNSHVPNGFLPAGFMRALKVPFIRTPLIWLLERGIFWREGDLGERAAKFAKLGIMATQEEIFDRVRRYYPPNTRFVVLPMDMEFMGAGSPDVKWPCQHDELNSLAKKYSEQIIPFAAVDTRRKNVVDELKRCIDMGFKGVKLYPPLGFSPSDNVLMDKVYPIFVENNLPIMSHCSRGGVKQKGTDKKILWKFAEPKAFCPVAEEFPELRICLAHFGGGTDWNEYLNEPRPDDLAISNKCCDVSGNWLHQILEILRNPKIKNIWTDISYTAFYYEQNLPALSIFLQDERIASRVLFGSDYYMAEQEKISERRLSMHVRYVLGEGTFNRIAIENPKVFLNI